MSLNRQSAEEGAVIIVLLLLMVLGLSSYLLKTVDIQAAKHKRAQNTLQSLGEAKTALIAWAVNNSVNLGQLPFPDRARGGGYDGFSDCLPSGSRFRKPQSYAFLIGKLPVYGQTSPCVGQQVGLGLDNNEHLEHRLWYAVSRNVVHQYEYLSSDPRSNPVINPSIIHHPTYSWLKVFNHRGQLISDRVAAVILAPGENIGAQTRADGAAPDQFLDEFYLDNQLYANHDYGRADEDFVIGEDMHTVDIHDTRLRKPYLFNDQLVFITIDELLAAIHKRVIAESKWLLRAYESNNGRFPNAADFSTATIQSNIYIAGNHEAGFVPFDVTDRCHCMSATQCSCAFGVIDTVTMYRTSGTWKSAEDAGACRSTLKASGKECTCHGAGSCSRTTSSLTSRFVCDAAGTCASQQLTNNAQNVFRYSLPSYADVHSLSAGCLMNRGEVECNATGSFDIGLKAPSWLKQNGWQPYIYYAWSPLHQLQAGVQQGIAALLIAMGEPVESEMKVNQSRPSDWLGDYLDSVENTNGDTIYESTLKRSTAAYNDAVFIVSP